MIESTEIIQIDFDRMPPNVKQFIEVELNKCRQHNIKINLPKTKTITHNGLFECAGYFDQEPEEFAVACAKSYKTWLSIFVHESCHMDQWIEDIPLWHEQVNDEDPLDLMDEWLLKKRELNDEDLNRVFDIGSMIELDCEKRSVDKIKKYNLPINLNRYIQKSNGYVWSYRLMQETRDWDHSAAYGLPEVWKSMPKHFDNDYSTLPDNIRTVFYKHIEKFSKI